MSSEVNATSHKSQAMDNGTMPTNVLDRLRDPPISPNEGLRLTISQFWERILSFGKNTNLSKEGLGHLEYRIKSFYPKIVVVFTKFFPADVPGLLTAEHVLKLACSILVQKRSNFPEDVNGSFNCNNCIRETHEILLKHIKELAQQVGKNITDYDLFSEDFELKIVVHGAGSPRHVSEWANKFLGNKPKK